VQGREHRQRNREDNNGLCSGSGVGSEDDDNARSVCIILPHWSERVDQEDEEHFIRQEQEHEWQEDEARGRRTIELGRFETPEPMGLVMTHSQEDIARSSSLPSSGYSTVISELYQQLTTLLTQLEPAAQSTISTLISKVTSLESSSLLNSPIHVSHRFIIIACDEFLSNNRLFTANLSRNHRPAVRPSFPWDPASGVHNRNLQQPEKIRPCAIDRRVRTTHHCPGRMGKQSKINPKTTATKFNSSLAAPALAAQGGDR
jgi:hypothetical protein